MSHLKCGVQPISTCFHAGDLTAMSVSPVTHVLQWMETGPRMLHINGTEFQDNLAGGENEMLDRLWNQREMVLPPPGQWCDLNHVFCLSEPQLLIGKLGQLHQTFMVRGGQRDGGRGKMSAVSAQESNCLGSAVFMAPTLQSLALPLSGLLLAGSLVIFSKSLTTDGTHVHLRTVSASLVKGTLIHRVDQTVSQTLWAS